MANNVLLFPPSKIANPKKTALHSDLIPQTIDEIKDIVKLNKNDKIIKIMDITIPILFENLAELGYDPHSDSEIKYGAFVIEAIRSLLAKHFGIDHPFQKLADGVFQVDANGKMEIKFELKEGKK